MNSEQDKIRATHLTCSRYPDVFERRIEVFNDMVLPKENVSDPSAEAGLDHELAVLKTFQRMTGCKLAIPVDGWYDNLFGERQLATFIHPEKIEHPISKEMVTWLAGTPDSGIVKNFSYLQDTFQINESLEGAPVQAKCRTWRKAPLWGDSIYGTAPQDTTLQVMAEIAVTKAALGTNCRYGFIVVLLGGPTDGDVRFYCVHLDEEDEENILAMGRDTWLAIQRKDVSMFSDNGDWKPFFKAVYPRETLPRYDDQDGSLAVLWKELAQAKEELAKLGAIKDGFETAIRRKCPEAEMFYTSDVTLGKNGLLFTNKKSKDGVAVDDAAVAEATYKAASEALAAASRLITKGKKAAFDEIVAKFPSLHSIKQKHSKPVIGSRRLLIKGLNGKANGND